MALYKVCTHLGCLYNWNEQEVPKVYLSLPWLAVSKRWQIYPGTSTALAGSLPTLAEDQTNGQVVAKSEDGSPMQVPQDPNAIIEVDTGKRIKGLPHG